MVQGNQFHVVQLSGSYFIINTKKAFSSNNILQHLIQGKNLFRIIMFDHCLKDFKQIQHSSVVICVQDGQLDLCFAIFNIIT